MNLSLEARYFFQTEMQKNGMKNCTLFFCRNDGIPLLYINGANLAADESSVGALVSGAWQASKALAAFIPKTSSTDDFRLGFDTSSSGIYVVPVQTQKMEYMLGIVYHDELNPALIKAKLRQLGSRFESLISQKFSGTQDGEKRIQYLFRDITDAEVEKLFSFARRA